MECSVRAAGDDRNYPNGQVIPGGIVAEIALQRRCRAASPRMAPKKWPASISYNTVGA
jgi:hypothetical protein